MIKNVEVFRDIIEGNCFDFIKNHLVSGPNVEEIDIFTMNFNANLIDQACKINKKARITVYVNDDFVDPNIIRNLEDSNNNLTFEFVEKNHIKGTVCKKSDGTCSAFFGSSNLTKGGMFDNLELNFHQDTELDAKDMEFSCSSVIQGLCNEIKDQTGVKVLDKKISKYPVEFLDAKKYGKIIKKKIEKFSNKNEKFNVEMCSQKIDTGLILDLFANYKDDINSLQIVCNELTNLKNLEEEFEKLVVRVPKKKVHAKYFSLFNNEKYFFGTGSSNISYSGLGLASNYVKKESNFVFEGSFDAFDDFAQFSEDPLDYVGNKYYQELKKYKKFMVKSERGLKKFNKMVNETIKKYKSLVEKVKKAEDYKNKMLILKEMYNKKEDDINKMYLFSFADVFYEKLLNNLL